MSDMIPDETEKLAPTMADERRREILEKKELKWEGVIEQTDHFVESMNRLEEKVLRYENQSPPSHVSQTAAVRCKRSQDKLERAKQEV